MGNCNGGLERHTSMERHTSLPLDWVPFISNLSRSQTGSVLLKLFDVFLEGRGSTDPKEAVCSDTHVEVPHKCCSRHRFYVTRGHATVSGICENMGLRSNKSTSFGVRLLHRHPTPQYEVSCSRKTKRQSFGQNPFTCQSSWSETM